MSGEPFSVTSGLRTSNNAHVSRAVILDPNVKAKLQDKPEVLGPVLFPDASAFEPPEPGGNGGPRNIFTAPGYWNADIGLIKVFNLSERFKLELPHGDVQCVQSYSTSIIHATLPQRVSPSITSTLFGSDLLRGGRPRPPRRPSSRRVRPRA